MIKKFDKKIFEIFSVFFLTARSHKMLKMTIDETNVLSVQPIDFVVGTCPFYLYFSMGNIDLIVNGFSSP